MDVSQDVDFVVCPKCGSEFQPHVTHCIDCGSPVRGRALLDRQRKEPARRDLRLPPDNEDLFKVPAGSFQEAKSLGRFLEEHDVPWGLAFDRHPEYPHASKYFFYYVCVEVEDFEYALELRQEHLLLENPGLAEEYIEMPSTHQCPACGAFVSPKVSECQSCGLALDGPPIDDEDETEEE